MGLPSINIAFEQRASKDIKGTGRGMVVILLQDATKNQTITPCRRFDDVSAADWTEESYEALHLVFAGTPTQVVAVRTAAGEGDAVDLPATLRLIQEINCDYLTYPGYQADDKVALVNWVKAQRQAGKKVKAVLPDCPADYEGVINYTTASVASKLYEDKDPVVYTAAQYCPRIAGVLAGIPLTQSGAYAVLEDVVDAATKDDPDTAVDGGELILIYDGDKYKIGRGVTSLQTITPTAPADFCKIKVVEGADIIRSDIFTTFADEYVGKVNNTYDNKQMLVGAILQYFKGLYDVILDGDADNTVRIDVDANRAYLEIKKIVTDEMTEQQIRTANTGANVFLKGKVKLLDAMEDLDLHLAM